MLEFCKVCKRCAEACPSGCISYEDEPSFEVKGEWNNPGHKAWFEDSPKCLAYWQESTSGCSNCIAVCPWTKKNKTMIHEIVKATSAKIPALGREMLELVLPNPERKRTKACLLDLPPMGVGVEAVITNCHLPLVGNMGGDPGDELQVVHPLHVFRIFRSSANWMQSRISTRPTAKSMNTKKK